MHVEVREQGVSCLLSCGLQQLTQVVRVSGSYSHLLALSLAFSLSAGDLNSGPYVYTVRTFTHQVATQPTA